MSCGCRFTFCLFCVLDLSVIKLEVVPQFLADTAQPIGISGQEAVGIGQLQDESTNGHLDNALGYK